MLFRFLNLSPPCAAKAARASSSGVLFGVIAGGATIELVAGVFEGLGLTAPGVWASAAMQSRNKTTSVGAYLFIEDFLSVTEPGAVATGCCHSSGRYRSRFCNYTLRRREGSEIKAQAQRYSTVTSVHAATWPATAKTAKATGETLRLAKQR